MKNFFLGIFALIIMLIFHKDFDRLDARRGYDIE